MDEFELKEEEIVLAIVVFRSMEGRERALKAYKDKLMPKFMEKYQLKLQAASDPKHIYWENLKASSFKKCFGSLLKLLLSLILISAVAAGLWYYQRELVLPFEKEYPPYDLYNPLNISEALALEDYYNSTVKFTDNYQTKVKYGFMR